MDIIWIVDLPVNHAILLVTLVLALMKINVKLAIKMLHSIQVPQDVHVTITSLEMKMITDNVKLVRKLATVVIMV